jgi:hypothetical protein
MLCGREPAPHLSLSGCNTGDAVSWRVIGDELFAVNLEKPPEQMRQHLELVISFYCRFVTLTPRHGTGDLQNVCSQVESAVAYHLRGCRGDGHACKRVS